jgi:hypothetical protein
MGVQTQKAGLMNAQNRTPGGIIRDDDDGGRGKRWLIVLVFVVVIGAIVLPIIL